MKKNKTQRKSHFLPLSAAVSALSVAVALVVPAWASAASFTDIDTTPGKEKIVALHDQGLIHGFSAAEFRPDAELNSAQGIQMLTSGLGLSLAAISFEKGPFAEDVFDHVKDGVWYTNAYLSAHYNGVELPKDIEPTSVLTREEFTFYLIQAIEGTGQVPLINIVPKPIKDEADMDIMHQGAIQRSLIWNIASLDDTGAFHPQRAITRAEAAVMVYNAAEVLKGYSEAPAIPTDTPAEPAEAPAAPAVEEVQE